ncbi:hypothetical protein HNQ59_000228 [Chitinivorax tropicus]|uniref:Uncharacterized protein n=1 Tax=Chitinivorax tropicus TaxID=714531 RepID=A0A840MK76_9PROT|nr:hypothetical protein [Chitinivorax tropicus]MBB5016966.1 hypothetical protein [Chitinivorax tropicus]
MNIKLTGFSVDLTVDEHGPARGFRTQVVGVGLGDFASGWMGRKYAL